MTSKTKLEDLRARLNRRQINILNTIAAYEEKNPAGMPAIAVNSNVELGEGQLEAALKPLGGDVVFSTGSDRVLRRFRLTFLGFLLTDRGEELEELFVRYFEFVQGLLRADPEARKVDLDAAIAECRFSAAQADLFKKMFYKSRFHGSDGGSDVNLPPHVDQWYAHSDLRRYVHEQVACTYDDNKPIDLDQQSNVVQVRTDAELNSSLAGKNRMKGEPEIAHVLFTDIVGYSKLPMEGQTKARQTLKEMVLQTSTFCEAKGSGNVISKPTGDGIALAFFGNPVAPVNCAIEISKLLRTLPDLPLRMGIHSGPVSRDEDINQQPDVAGGGINYAQRAMDAGAGGHILLTRAVAEILYQLEGWSDYLHDLGEISVKHGVRLHVFNLYSDEFGNPEAPEKSGPITPTPVMSHVSRSSNDATVRLALVREIDVNLDFLGEMWNRILDRVTFQRAPLMASIQKGDAIRALALPSWRREKWDKLLEQATVALTTEEFEKVDVFHSKLERLTYLRAGNPDRWRIEAELIISDLVAEGNPLR